MHLPAEAIARMPAQRKVHFLNEQAVRLNKSLGDAVGLKQLGAHLITVLPGHASTEPHVHHCEEECIYVLSGQGLATLGDRTVTIGAGDFIGCPINGVAHDMQATGSEPLVCLVIGQRLAQDVTDYPRLGKRLYRHHGEWNLVAHADIVRIER